MPQLFCSYKGTQGGKTAQGWCVLDFRPVADDQAVVDLVNLIEKERGYDPESVILISFQRLEG